MPSVVQMDPATILQPAKIRDRVAPGRDVGIAFSASLSHRTIIDFVEGNFEQNFEQAYPGKEKTHLPLSGSGFFSDTPKGIRTPVSRMRT